MLAGLVAASHLWSRMIQGYAAYAVWGFYVLSGYLMTYILVKKYGLRPTGLRDYAVNRFIRIYPGYWIAVILGIITIAALGRSGIDTTRLNPEFYLPEGSKWLNPLTLIPLFSRTGLPVAVSSALAIEIGAYILMPLLASARSAAWAVAAVSFLVSFDLRFDPTSFSVRYATFVPCLLPFAVGALIFHYREHLLRFAAPRLSVVIWMLHGLAWLKLPHWPWTYGLYVSMFLSGWVALSLTARRSGKVDTLFGDLSYPVYLLHTIVGAWFLSVWDYQLPFRLFAASMVVTFGISFLLVKLVERPLARRKRVPVNLDLSLSS